VGLTISSGVSSHYAALVATLPDVEYAEVHGGMVRFRFKGGQGVVMPMKK